MSRARVVVVGAGAVAEHAAAGLGAAGLEPLRATESEVGSGFMAGTECVLVGLDEPMPALLDAVNSAALREQWKWLPGQVEWGVGMIGPLVVPGQSACYRCFVRRREANLPGSPAAADGARAAPGPLAACIGGLMALEAVRLISGVASPGTLGRVLKLDFFTEMTWHRVLRLPNCPDCGYGRRKPPLSPLPAR